MSAATAVSRDFITLNPIRGTKSIIKARRCEISAWHVCEANLLIEARVTPCTEPPKVSRS